MSEQYEKEYFIGIVTLQSDLDVLKKALMGIYYSNATTEEMEKGLDLLKLIENQETAQKKWNDDDKETEMLKDIGVMVGQAFKGEIKLKCNFDKERKQQ